MKPRTMEERISCDQERANHDMVITPKHDIMLFLSSNCDRITCQRRSLSAVALTVATKWPGTERWTWCFSGLNAMEAVAVFTLAMENWPLTLISEG